MGWPLTCLIVFLVALNTAATIRVLFLKDLWLRQRLYQALFIWLIPLVGAIVCLVASGADKQDSTRDPNYRPPDEPWDLPYL